MSFIFLDILTLLTTFLTSSMTTPGLSDKVCAPAFFTSAVEVKLLLFSLIVFLLFTLLLQLVSFLLEYDLSSVGIVSKLDEKISGSDKMSARFDLLLSLTGAL